MKVDDGGNEVDEKGREEDGEKEDEAGALGFGDVPCWPAVVA